VRSRPAARLAVAAAALALACQSAGTSTPPVASPATLEVEVLRGFAPEPRVQLQRQVVVLADLRTADRRARQAEAERAAAFAEALPPSTDVRIHVVGARTDEACGAGSPIESDARAAAVEQLTTTSGGGAGSVGRALERATEGAHAGTRVVAFSAADDGCADLCAAVEGAAERGVWVDWVVPDGATPPACLVPAARPLAGPGPIGRALAPGPTAFQVRTGSASDGQQVASGRAGDLVAVAPGELTVWLDLEPPEPAGPLHVTPGERLKVRVLDFPMTDPPVRRWWVEREGGQ
jgi:hypothetical protein